MSWEVVIGLEVHCQINTKPKHFVAALLSLVQSQIAKPAPYV